jgi:hypothetical protein
MGVSIGGNNGIRALAADRTQTAHGGVGVTAHGEVIAAFPRARAALAAATHVCKRPVGERHWPLSDRALIMQLL